MGKTTDNICEICTQDEFEQFESIHEQLTKFIKKPDSLSDKEYEKLIDDIEEFWPTIVEMAKKVDIDLSDKFDILINILEQPELTYPDEICSKWSGGSDVFGGNGGFGDAVEEVFDEYENKQQNRKETIANLDKLMVILYPSQPKDTGAIETNHSLMIEAFEDALERVKANHAGKENKRWIILITGWIFKKTSHFILTVIVTILATVIAAIAVDIFADFGWLQSIKAFISKILWPK